MEKKTRFIDRVYWITHPAWVYGIGIDGVRMSKKDIDFFVERVLKPTIKKSPIRS